MIFIPIVKLWQYGAKIFSNCCLLGTCCLLWSKRFANEVHAYGKDLNPSHLSHNPETDPLDPYTLQKTTFDRSLSLLCLRGIFTSIEQMCAWHQLPCDCTSPLQREVCYDPRPHPKDAAALPRGLSRRYLHMQTDSVK